MLTGESLKSNGTADTLAGLVPITLIKTMNGSEKARTARLLILPLAYAFVNRISGKTASEQTPSAPLWSFFIERGVDELYTQTWSGNVLMVRCAEKLGFVECDREVGEREVDGQKYDGLTFRKMIARR